MIKIKTNIQRYLERRRNICYSFIILRQTANKCFSYADFYSFCIVLNRSKSVCWCDDNRSSSSFNSNKNTHIHTQTYSGFVVLKLVRFDSFTQNSTIVEFKLLYTQILSTFNYTITNNISFMHKSNRRSTNTNEIEENAFFL